MPFLNTDIPELSGFDTGLCLSNLDILGLRQNRVSESVLAILSELADALIHDAGGDPDTVDSILLSLQSTPDIASIMESCSLMPAKTTSARAKPRAVLMAKTTPVSRFGSSPCVAYVPLATRMATPTQ